MVDHNVFSGLDVVYHDAGEREIRFVNVYANTSKLYTDAKHTNEIAYDLAVEICEKGFMRVFDTDTFYTVTSFKDADSTLTVGYGASKTATVSAAAAASTLEDDDL